MVGLFEASGREFSLKYLYLIIFSVLKIISNII